MQNLNQDEMSTQVKKAKYLKTAVWRRIQVGTAGICPGLCPVNDLEGDTKVRALLKQKREES